MTIYTYDNNLNLIEADIDFVCLNAQCDIGITEISGGDAVLSAKFPQCVNGKIVAKAEGYADAEVIVSTNEPDNVNILMDKLYEVNVEVFVSGMSFSNQDMAIINFVGEDNNAVVVYPEQRKVSLSEDYYEIDVQVFSKSSLTIPASSSRQCVEVSKPGLLGLFGRTNEQCFEIEMPEQKIENALVAGGNIDYYILESDLTGARKIRLGMSSLPRPASLEQLQQNYELLETNKLEVDIL